MTCVHDATIKQYTTEQNQEKKEKQRVTRYLVEVETIRNIRKRTFSHWPHKIPSKSQIIEAGFFYCNVGDRVICIYCNIICQQWTSHSDDPIEIHKILSPNCPYVRSMLKRSISANNIRILNEIDQKSSQTTAIINSSNTTPMKTNNNNMINSKEIVLTAASNQQFTELPKRTASFITWPTESLPSVDDLVKSGFFYTGNKTIVTCFYCNGSLQNWGPNDNPMIEHSRWFPHCAYARQLCGDDLYRKIQETKRIAQERLRANEQRSERFSVSNTHENSNNTDNSSPMNSEIVLNNKELQLPDENTLSRLVAARLDLPISQNLLKKFKLSIIKRCYEDQLRLKHNDFVSDCDLLMACNILQKQIEHIDGKKENIIIPSVHMKTLREQAEKERIEKETVEQNLHLSNSPRIEFSSISSSSNSSCNEDTNMTSVIDEMCTSTSSISSMESNASVKSDKKSKPKQNPQMKVSNPCVLCLTDERRLASIPCGHLVTCVPCGHSLRTCPICRRSIEAFVRVYI